MRCGIALIIQHRLIYRVRFYVLTAAGRKMPVFCFVQTCSLVEFYWPIREAYCPHRQCTLRIQAANASETSVNFYQTVRLNKQADSHFKHIYRSYIRGLMSDTAVGWHLSKSGLLLGCSHYHHKSHHILWWAVSFKLRATCSWGWTEHFH
jgi:hypothetical protein